jgi:hypothetical protein
MQLQPGQLISAPFLPATAEIKKFELRSGYALLEVVLHDGHQTYKPLRITSDQLDQIEILDQEPAAVAANAEDFFFFDVCLLYPLSYCRNPRLDGDTGGLVCPITDVLCIKQDGMRWL